MASPQEQEIVQIFMENVYGKSPDTSQQNQNHDGKKGHWLETQMGIKPNASNAPDLLGFEMKNQTTSKTTFGDWSPNYFIFNDKEIIPREKGVTAVHRRNTHFLPIWGQPNIEKENRLSWSGKPIPKIDQWNGFGCILLVCPNNDIEIVYDYQRDLRLDKESIVPQRYRQSPIVIARWDATKLAKKVNDKFNQKGWFTCKTDNFGVYHQICFGDPITFNNWIYLVKIGVVFYDSGMYETNPRPYAQWRANNSYWDSLIRQTYP
jgi:hypothetical protein